MEFGARALYAVAPIPRCPRSRSASQEIPTATFIEALGVAAEHLAIGDGDLLDRLLSACGYILSMGVAGGQIPATVQDEMDAWRRQMVAASHSEHPDYSGEAAAPAGPHESGPIVRYLQSLMPDDQKALARDILRWLSETIRADAHWLATNDGGGALVPAWHFEP